MYIAAIGQIACTVRAIVAESALGPAGGYRSRACPVDVVEQNNFRHVAGVYPQGVALDVLSRCIVGPNGLERCVGHVGSLLQDNLLLQDGCSCVDLDRHSLGIGAGECDSGLMSP